MTAHNRSIGFGLNDRACAVTDRAYSHLDVLRTTIRFVSGLVYARPCRRLIRRNR
jgi:hypothetical protein